MGINRLPALADYWKLDPTYRYRPIADKITRDRFMEITRYFHFVDNSTLPLRTDPGYDKLGKIRPVIDHISRQFLSVYSPHCEASIDEAMVAFKGRSTMKQYLPKKPVKRGFKVWVRADAVSGYVSEFDIYTGKVVGEGEFGLGGNGVKRLTCNITGRNHQLTGSYNSRKYGGWPPTNESARPRRMHVPHYLTKTTQGRCRMCSKYRRRGMTSWWCSECQQRLYAIAIQEKQTPTAF